METYEGIQEIWKGETIEGCPFNNEEQINYVKKLTLEKETNKENQITKAEQLKQKLDNNSEKENKIPKWRKVICTGKTDENEEISIIYNKNKWKKIIINNKEYKLTEWDGIKDWWSILLHTKIWSLYIKNPMHKKVISISFRWKGIKLLDINEEQYWEFYKSWTTHKDTSDWKNKKSFWKRIKDFFKFRL